MLPKKTASDLFFPLSQSPILSAAHQTHLCGCSPGFSKTTGFKPSSSPSFLFHQLCFLHVLLFWSMFLTSSCINSDSLKHRGWGEEPTLFANSSSDSGVRGPHTTRRKAAVCEGASLHLVTRARNVGIILVLFLPFNHCPKGQCSLLILFPWCVSNLSLPLYFTAAPFLPS